jgi:syntaxin 5
MQLAGLVHDQGLQMERIDADIADTQHNVEQAHTEIAKYFQSITTNRMLILKTFATLIALFALFMMFK